MNIRFVLVLLVVCPLSDCASVRNAESVGTCSALPAGERPADTTVYDTTRAVSRPVMHPGPMPRYADRALELGIQGRLILQAIVGADGRIEQESIRVFKSFEPQTDRDAVRVLGRTTFQPACLGAQPVRFRIHVPYDFKIMGPR